MSRLANKVALVTVGSRDIGAAFLGDPYARGIKHQVVLDVSDGLVRVFKIELGKKWKDLSYSTDFVRTDV